MFFFLDFLLSFFFKERLLPISSFYIQRNPTKSQTNYRTIRTFLSWMFFFYSNVKFLKESLGTCLCRNFYQNSNQMWELEKKLRHKLNFPCWFFFFFFVWVSFLFLAQSFWSCLNHNSVLHILYIPSKALTNKKHMVRKRYRKTTASGTHFPTILECSALSCHSWTTGSINTNLAIP